MTISHSLGCVQSNSQFTKRELEEHFIGLYLKTASLPQVLQMDHRTMPAELLGNDPC